MSATQGRHVRDGVRGRRRRRARLEQAFDLHHVEARRRGAQLRGVRRVGPLRLPCSRSRGTCRRPRSSTRPRRPAAAAGARGAARPRRPAAPAARGRRRRRVVRVVVVLALAPGRRGDGDLGGRGRRGRAHRAGRRRRRPPPARRAAAPDALVDGHGGLSVRVARPAGPVAVRAAAPRGSQVQRPRDAAASSPRRRRRATRPREQDPDQAEPARLHGDGEPRAPRRVARVHRRARVEELRRARRRSAAQVVVVVRPVGDVM